MSQGLATAQPSHEALERLRGLPQDTPIYPRVDAELAGPVDMDPVRPEYLESQQPVLCSQEPPCPEFRCHSFSCCFPSLLFMYRPRYHRARARWEAGRPSNQESSSVAVHLGGGYCWGLNGPEGEEARPKFQARVQSAGFGKGSSSKATVSLCREVWLGRLVQFSVCEAEASLQKARASSAAAASLPLPMPTVSLRFRKTKGLCPKARQGDTCQAAALSIQVFLLRFGCVAQ